MRPWKAEQLGGGYAVSSWVERTAYEAAAAVIAVSAAMRDDVLRSYPAVDPGQVQVVHNGIDTELWSPVHDADRVRVARRRPRPPVGRLRRPDHPPEGAAALPARGRPAAARRPGRPVRRRARHPRDRGRGRWASSTGSRESRDGVVWIRDMLPARRRRRPADRRHRVRLPLDLRATGHREPRGDGVRDRRRGHRDRRHPRGRRRPARARRVGRTRHRAAGPDRPGHRRHRHPAGPRPLRGRLRRRPDRGRHRPRPGRRDGQGRPPARHRRVQLGRDRRADRGGLPLGASELLRC